MIRLVVDTNVPVVANGRPSYCGSRNASLRCRSAAVEFLQNILRNHKVLIDAFGEIQSEYRRHLSPTGQPGVGDLFYREILNCSPRFVERVDILKNGDGDFEDLPIAVRDAGFDISDRKFAAIARKEGVPVANAVDSDWLHHRDVLRLNGIEVIFVCTDVQETWLE